MKWCMHKDEIVLNTAKCVIGDNCVKAYPMVVTTVGDMETYTKHYLTNLYKQSNATDFFRNQQTVHGTSAVNIDRIKREVLITAKEHDNNVTEALDEPLWQKAMTQIKALPDFRCQGIALGQAWASYLSGDTVASVLVGGMVTVQNGHFTMHTGDMVQWYFDWESKQFNGSNKNNGWRRPSATPARVATAPSKNAR